MVPLGGPLGGAIPGGWRFVPALYSGLLLATAAAVWLICPEADHMPGNGRPMGEVLAPLRFVRVWRFSLYYVAVFGAYVALSAWLPNYYRNTFGVDLRTAALLTALYIFPASLLRPLGGWLSDRYGPRVVTYTVFIGMTVVLIPLCLPVNALDWGVAGFTVLMVLVGVAMGVGKASVYKYVPNYYPRDVGAVGGLGGGVAGVVSVILELGTDRFGAPEREVEAALRAISDRARVTRIVHRVGAAAGWADLLTAPGRSATKCRVEKLFSPRCPLSGVKGEAATSPAGDTATSVGTATGWNARRATARNRHPPAPAVVP